MITITTNFKIFALSDLHLSFAKPKPMNKFGPQWEGHPEIIEKRWNKIVGKNDIVLIAGDISWASKLDTALIDLFFIDKLNGIKIFVKGNHDFWFKGIQNIRKVLKDTSLYPLRNDCIVINNIGIVGTKGYNLDRITGLGIRNLDNFNSSHFLKEKNRLDLSIQDAKKKNVEKIIAMLHYPPFKTIQGGSTPLTKTLSKADVKDCVYGHIHTEIHQSKCFQGKLDRVNYHMTSCDYLKFQPKLIVDNLKGFGVI
jgi:hypothetical protein